MYLWLYGCGCSAYPTEQESCLPSFSWSHVEGCNPIAVVDARARANPPAFSVDCELLCLVNLSSFDLCCSRSSPWPPQPPQPLHRRHSHSAHRLVAGRAYAARLSPNTCHCTPLRSTAALRLSGHSTPLRTHCVRYFKFADDFVKHMSSPTCISVHC